MMRTDREIGPLDGMGQVLLMVVVMTAFGGERSPRFEDYPFNGIFTGQPVLPIPRTPQERRFRTRIREGVTIGRGVWTGSWKQAKERAAPNFAGHYFVIRWGCGSECLMMAVVDALTGTVYPPPLSVSGSELEVPMDPLSDREIWFRVDSTLMVFQNGCASARKQCVYYFNWESNRFRLIRRVLMNLDQ